MDLNDKMRYNPEITFGNILSILSMVTVVVGVWVTTNNRIAKLEIYHDLTLKNLHKLESSVGSLYGSQNKLTVEVSILNEHFKNHRDRTIR